MFDGASLATGLLAFAPLDPVVIVEVPDEFGVIGLLVPELAVPPQSEFSAVGSSHDGSELVVGAGGMTVASVELGESGAPISDVTNDGVEIVAGAGATLFVAEELTVVVFVNELACSADVLVPSAGVVSAVTLAVSSANNCERLPADITRRGSNDSTVNVNPRRRVRFV